MSYIKIRLIFNSAKEAYERGEISYESYMNILNDLDNQIIKVDNLKTKSILKRLLANTLNN
jgi:hypothetical protein